MADSQFKYIINTELKLNTGSLKTLLSDIGTMDKTIKGHFDKNGGGVRVPLTVDKDIKKLQGDIKKVIDGYNKGQAPSIRIPIEPDESSIRKLQNRISAIKKQLNSLSDEKNGVSINTSLKVGSKEKENIQKQVGDTKATVVVGLRIDDKEITKIQKQIESIHAEVNAVINETARGNRFSRSNVDRSVGASNTVGRISSEVARKVKEHNLQTVGNNKANKFLTGRKQITDEIKSIKDMQKAYQDEFKEIGNLQKYKDALIKRVNDLNKKSDQTKVYYQDEFTGGKRKQTSKDKFNEQKKEWEDAIVKIDELSKLREQLANKEKELSNFEKSFAYDGRSTETPSSKITKSHSVSKIKSNLDAEKARQDALNQEQKARHELMLKEQSQREQEEAKFIQEYNKRTNSNINNSEKPQTLGDRYKSVYEQMSTTQTQLGVLRSTINSKDIRSRMSDKDKNVALGNLNKLSSRFESLKKEADEIEAEIQRIYYPNRVKDMSSAYDMADIENRSLNRVQNPDKAHSEAKKINDSINRQEAKQEKQRKANERDRLKTQSANQAIDDFNNGTRRFGPNGMYSAHDYEAMLQNPNISLGESKRIIEEVLNPYNKRMAINNGMNFQKAYGIQFRDESGNIRQIRSLTYEYTKFGEVIEKGDKGFGAMMEHIVSRVGIYSLLEGALAGVSVAILKSVADMAQFDAQLADVLMTTKDLSSQGDTLQKFYSNVGSTSAMESQVQNDTFKNAETYGVSALNTVMPIEQQVIARRNLVAGADNKYDPNIKDDIVQKIMQFSAISTGGNETPEETNKLTQDMMSLYQAYYTKDPKQYRSNMNDTFNFLTNMKTHGVNTTAVADAMAELAPDTITAGVDGKKVMAMMGAYNLSDASATGEDIQTISRTFFGTLRHASTNSNIKSALQMMGIDLNTKNMSTSDLLDAITKNFGNLTDAQKEQFAQAFSGTSGQSKAMVPKMVKFLDASQGSEFSSFLNSDNTNAMKNAWLPFSEKLKTQFDGLVEKLQEFVQLIGRLGVLDGLGLLVKTFTGLLNIVNSLLRSVQGLSDAFEHSGFALDIPKVTIEILALTTALKGLRAFTNKAEWGGAVGDYLAGRFSGRTFGVKRNYAPNSYGVGSVASEVGTVIANSVPIETVPVVRGDVVTAGTSVAERTAIQSTERQAASRGGRILGSIGNFIGDALMLNSLKGVGSIKGAVASKADGAISRIIGGFVSMLPVLRGFALLLTRLTLVGGALTLGFMALNKAIDSANKERKAETKKVSDNLKKNQSRLQSNPSFGKEIQHRVDSLIKANKAPTGITFTKDGMSTITSDSKDAKYLKEQFGISYIKNSKEGNYIKYTDGSKDENGNLIYQKYHIGNTKEKKKFDNFLKNGAVSDIQKIANAWKDSTSYLQNYLQDLAKIQYLSKNVSETMLEMTTNQKAINAKFAGINSTASLNAQIQANQQGMKDTSNQIKEMEDKVSNLRTNRDRSQSAFDNMSNKAISKGVLSQSKIAQATDELTYALQNGKDPNTVFSEYKVLDKNNADDVKAMQKQGIANKKGKINEKALNNYNNKMSAMTEILTIFQALLGFQSNFQQGSESLQQVKQQKLEQEESQKQLISQSIVTSLGLDALSASLNRLGAVASATKALVDINTNYLQTGNNNAQISALHTSAKVSVQQMANLTTQNNRVQSAMADLVKNNPNQDFSLSQLYNPSGTVTPEQLAYKSMYEQSQQITQNISNQSSAMFEQLQQMKDLILNSNKYADSWQRIQDTIQDVRAGMKNITDTQFQLSTVNSNSILTSALTGQNVFDVKQQSLQSIRDNSLGMATKLNTDLASYPYDNSQMTQAWNDIIQQMGSEFQSAMINPLKSIVSSIGNSDSVFSSSVGNFNTGVDNFTKAVNAINTNMSSMNADNSLSPTDANGRPSGAESIPSFTSSGSGTMTEQQYLESLGFKAGSVDYMSAKKQFDSMSPSDQQSVLNQGGGNQSYIDSINKMFKGTSLEGMGSAYVRYGAQYGVDPRLMASITMQETGGNSHALNAYNNVGGIMGKGGLRHFSSVDSSIEYLANLLKTGYFDEGKNTIPDIQSKYAPVGAGNDPTGLNNSWQVGVASFYSKMTGLSTSQLLGGTPITSSLRADSGSYSTGNGSNGKGNLSAMMNELSYLNGRTPANGGLTYKWGGAHVEEDWATFMKNAVADCSGFIEQIYKQFAGINLGTGTADSVMKNNNGGKVVGRNGLSVGDLVFFGNRGNATHAGVYAGNGQYYSMYTDGKPEGLRPLGNSFIEGKHFNIGNGGDISSQAFSQLSGIQTQIGDAISGIEAERKILNSYASGYSSKTTADLETIQAQGNMSDLLGTSGVTGRYDRITQARKDLMAQLVSDQTQMQSALAQRDSITNAMNSAKQSGDTATYNAYKSELDATNNLIVAIKDNSENVKELSDAYAKWQQYDPRVNSQTASGYILNGLKQIQTYVGKSTNPYSVDFFRTANEVQTMNGEYMNHKKQTDSLQYIYDTYGEQANTLSYLKNQSDQDSVNLITEKITSITKIFKEFAQGTAQWYSSLSTAVKAEQDAHDLETTKLSNAQSMFNLTGQGVQGYVQQKAYVQSKDYSQNVSNVQSGISQLKSGTFTKGSGLATGVYDNMGSAQEVVNYLAGAWGVSGNIADEGITSKKGRITSSTAKVYAQASTDSPLVETLKKNGEYNVYGGQNGWVNVGAGYVQESDMQGLSHSYRVSTDNVLTASKVGSINSDLQSRGLTSLAYTEGGGTSTMDFNQQMSTIQVIADAHNSMMQQMNDYKQAVADAFKAGALSVDEYISKLNQLRDVQTEMKQSATDMISGIQQGFQSSLSSALTQGMQGGLNSPLDFMNSIKSTLSSSISGQLSSILLNNTGLQDVMNKMTSSVTKAATSGDPNSIVNMFNNNDFGKQMQDALQPFIPMIEQIIGSTKGIFTILKNQTFNAPSGFKIDNYMNEVASRIGYQGIKNMNPNVNDVGSPIYNTPSGSNTTLPVSTTSTSGITTTTTQLTGGNSPIVTTAPSQTPTGIPTTVSGSGSVATGAPENTTGTPTPAPSTASQTTLPPTTSSSPSSSSSSSSGIGHYVRDVQVYYDTNLYKEASKSSTVIGKLYHGQKYRMYGEVNRMVDLGGGYADGTKVYHTGGIAGLTNFASGQGLKPNELSAILQKSETIFQPRQLDDLVNGAMKAGVNSNNDGGVNLTVNVNIDGGGNYDQGGIEAVVETAVTKAMAQFKKTVKMNNLTWKGTSY